MNLLSIQYTAQGKYSYAIKAGKEALNLLDVKLPEIISTQTVEAALAEVELLVGNKEVKDLINIEEMTNDKNQLIMNILINMDSPCYLSDIDLYCIIVSKMVCFSIEHGLVAESAKAFASYAIVLCSYDKYSLGLEFGKVGIKIAERFNHLGQLCRVCHTMANHVQYWSEPISLGDSVNDRGFIAGHDAGEYLWAGFIKLFKPYNQFFASRNLNLIAKDVDEGLLYCREHPNQLGIDSLTGLSLIIQELSDPKAPFDIINNKHESYVEICHTTNSLMALSMYLSLKSFILLLKGDLSFAKKVNDQSLGLSKFSYSLVSNVYDDFVCCLLALYEATDRNTLDSERFNQSFSKIKKISDSAPSNFKGLFFIIDAEYKFLSGGFYDGVEALESAIEICSKNTMYSFEAYALKRLAYHWSRVKKKSDIAKYYEEQSLAVLQKWGALNLIKNKKHTIGEQGINLFLDNSKTSQVQESSEEYFKNSLNAFVNLLNADSAGFYIKNDQEVFELISSHGLFEEENYIGIVNYVSRTGTKLAKADLVTIGLGEDFVFREDDDLVFFPCDNLAVFVFVKSNRDWNYNENISLVNILLQQMSLYLRNRELVRKVSDFNTALEEQVDMRTRELKNERDKAQSISDDLRKTQRDLVESAKNAGRSEIAANIIHNLGNGLMFAAGQVELLELYMEDHESLTGDDKIRAGVTKLSRKMHEMIKLIKNERGINKSYVVKELCDVSDLITEAFVFSKGDYEIQHKINNSLKFPVSLDIEKIKNILINIYSNAFFACSNLSYEPLIVTDIQVKEAKLEIKIVDNGVGISKDSLKLLFNPGYTTKGNQGTGYGLHNSSVILGHMGGCIIAQSDGVNMGASFTIILPV